MPALFIAVVFGLGVYLTAAAGSETTIGVIQKSLWMTAFTVVGAFIVIRVPGNVVGWLCLGLAGSWALWMLGDGLVAFYTLWWLSCSVLSSSGRWYRYAA